MEHALCQRKQSLHVAGSPADVMAGRWRRLLQEESEHQWVSIAVFFVFVLMGAFAIGATEHFVGARVMDTEANHAGGLVTEIAYHQDSETYTALVYAPDAGYSLFTEDMGEGTTKAIYSPDTVDQGANVQFLKTMPDGEILFSTSSNQLIGLQGEFLVTYEYTTTNGVFGVRDVAEQNKGDATYRLLLTQEGSNSSIRGVVGMTPTPAMSTSLGVMWHQIEGYNETHWIAIGTHFSTAGADGSSPATPQSRPVLGWIEWNGTEATPVVDKVQTFDSGIFHSIAKNSDSIVIGGTMHSLVIHTPERVETLNIPCGKVVADTSGKVWLIGQLGSSTISTYLDGDVRTYVLGKPMPVEQSSVGSSGDFVHVHGVDANGDPIQWSIDTTANGSIESGRGFLNLLYLMVGSVLLALMLRYAVAELRQPV